MVSAPETNWTSVQATPASARASRAAASPYSTKLRPHLPQGCMPAPSTATLLSSGTGRPRSRPTSTTSTTSTGSTGSTDRTPFPHHVLVVVVLIEGVEYQLD